jgi:beta-lactamase superfamily II metal-dependent hydrolase
VTPDQVEVSLFGPGFGECILIHIGGGQWIVLDSCVSLTQECVALEYLRRNGFDANAIKLIVATHWHDDHVRGLSQILAASPNATFTASMAMSAKEFIALALARNSLRATAATSGVDEITRVFSMLKTGGRIVQRAKENTTLFRVPGSDLPHGFDCTITALSPSDKQLETFLDDIAELAPDSAKSESRCVSRGANHFSIVCLVQIGSVSILLGADLEETADAKTGWSVIVKSQLRPKTKASIFKIPHHGSQNAHNEQVWNEMLIGQPFAILTPWGRGAGLPQDRDVARINTFTANAYSTSRLGKTRSRATRSPAVERTLRESGLVITNAEPPLGHVCLQNGGLDNFDRWQVTLDRHACALSEVHSPGSNASA